MLRAHWALGEGQDPQDVEWAFDGERIWLVQARPATHLRRAVPGEVAALPTYWSTANIKDAVPGVVCTSRGVCLDHRRRAGVCRSDRGRIRAASRGRGCSTDSWTGLLRADADAVGFARFAGCGACRVRAGHGRAPARNRVGRRDEGRQAPPRQSAAPARAQGVEGVRAPRGGGETPGRGSPSHSRAPVPEMSRAELSNVFEHLMRVHDRLDPAVGLANIASGPWELGLMGILQPMFGDRARAVMGRLLAGTGSVSSAEHGYARPSPGEHRAHRSRGPRLAEGEGSSG